MLAEGKENFVFENSCVVINQVDKQLKQLRSQYAGVSNYKSVNNSIYWSNELLKE